MNRNIILRGVSQNNLKDIDLDLPLGKAIVVTGPSGSGKSSLAFDTIYAEGQRRYMQSLSTYARQFMEKFRPPQVKSISNIPPTIALEQFNPVRNSRATVGTTTELYDFLRLLFEKIGIEFCSSCDLAMERLTYSGIFKFISQKYAEKTILICFEKKLPKNKSMCKELLEEYLRSGYSRFIHDTQLTSLEDEISKTHYSGSDVAFVVDRINIPPQAKSETIQTRLSESLRTAMEFGNQMAELYLWNDKKCLFAENLTTLNRCPRCKATSQPKNATSFSFNSPLGACITCKGFGNILEVDPELIIPRPELSIARGAIEPFTKPSLNHWQKKLLTFCKSEKMDADLPYRELPEKHKMAIFEGTKKFLGVKGVFRLLEKEKYKMRIRVFVSRYTSAYICPDCSGHRLNPSRLKIKVGGKNIAEICNLSIDQCLSFFQELSLSDTHRRISEDLLSQIFRRLGYLSRVGIGYITLSRLSRSLSSGEYQRILLATQLSQGLTDTLYVLDEPSIGLHPKDTQRLLEVLEEIKNKGNTLVIVEHDPEIIEWGEHIIDLGPGSGRYGGEVVFEGNQEKFLLSDSETSLAIRNWRQACTGLLSKVSEKKIEDWLEIRGAFANNLKHIDVKIPLNCLVAVTGLSGSGKSSLIVDTLYQALSKIFYGRSDKIGRFESISGFEQLSGVEFIDQSPIGKSSRSNPITFMKGFDEIRNLFANTRDAAAKKLTPGHFSFNVSGGRCDECEGEGRVKIDMVFMEDIWVPCQTCNEKRYKPSILEIRYRQKNIDDCLHMTIEEAFSFFEGIPSLRSKLALLQEVGLGYLQLGQPSYTLSGGEAQRLKIARELSRGTDRKLPILFILDEPTTGLHFREIVKLLHVLNKLISTGNSVIFIEHNIQMIASAHFIVDLGPDGGEHGGSVVAMGTPKQLAQKRLPHTGSHLAEILK